jgi:cytidylate kinase
LGGVGYHAYHRRSLAEYNRATIVAISRELGAGGLSVGEAIAAEIGASLLDERTLIAELAARGGFSAEYLRRVDEAPPSLASTFVQDIARATALVYAMGSFDGARRPRRDSRDRARTRCERHVVLIGHGGSSLLVPHVDRKDVFSLLLHASRSWRIGQVIERFAIGRSEAERRVRQTDELRRRYVQHFFSTDIYDAHNYDLVLDTERTGMPAAIAIAFAAYGLL